GRIGRMAVLPEWRGRGVGAALLQTVLDLARDLRHAEVQLHAQIDAVGFYQRHGLSGQGDEFVEAGIRHRLMRLQLAPLAPVQRSAPPATPPARLLETTSLAEVRAVIVDLLDDARRQLWICSRD